MNNLIGKNLTAGYGGVDIIKDINLEVNEGEIVVIVGPNGAGKSTVMKALLGMLKLTSGSVDYSNKEITKCKDNILTYMKTKMSKDRRKILSLLASKQYGLKEISELLNMDYGKVRKERSFANKELREAFPECYQIFAKKRGENK